MDNNDQWPPFGEAESIRRAGYSAAKSTAVVNLLKLAAINAPEESALTDREVDAKIAKLVRSADPNVSMKAAELHDKRKQRAKEQGTTPEDDALFDWQLGITNNSMFKTIDADAAKRHEALLLPDGRRIGDVKHHELASIFDKLKIPGFSHTLSRSAAIEKYAEYIEPIAKAGADKAVAEWLEKTGACKPNAGFHNESFRRHPANNRYSFPSYRTDDGAQDDRRRSSCRPGAAGDFGH